MDLFKGPYNYNILLGLLVFKCRGPLRPFPCHEKAKRHKNNTSPSHSPTTSLSLLLTMPFTLQEVSRHNSPKCVLMYIHGDILQLRIQQILLDYHPRRSVRCNRVPSGMSQIYSTFNVLIRVLQAHPGGSQIILKYGGRDATDAFEPSHPPNVLEHYLPKEKHLGDLDLADTEMLKSQRDSKEKTEDELRVEREHAAKPPLNRVLDLQQMEVRFLSSPTYVDATDTVTRTLREGCSPRKSWPTIRPRRMTRSVSFYTVLRPARLMPTFNSAPRKRAGLLSFLLPPKSPSPSLRNRPFDHHPRLQVCNSCIRQQRRPREARTPSR